MEKTVLALAGVLLLGACAPVYEGAQTLLGNAATQRGDYQQAILAYNEARSARDSLPWVLYNLGNVYNALGESSAALELWDQVDQALYPELEFRLAFNRGHLLYQKGRYAEAYAEFRRALLLDSRSLDAKRNLELALGKWQAQASAPLGGEGPRRGAASRQVENARAVLDYIRRVEQARLQANRQTDPSPQEADW